LDVGLDSDQVHDVAQEPHDEGSGERQTFPSLLKASMEAAKKSHGTGFLYQLAASYQKLLCLLTTDAVRLMKYAIAVVAYTRAN
jgi:hypothetical protein